MTKLCMSHASRILVFRLKTERHTEFVSYTIYEEGAVGDPFRPGVSRSTPSPSAPVDLRLAAAAKREPEHRDHPGGDEKERVHRDAEDRVGHH